MCDWKPEEEICVYESERARKRPTRTHTRTHKSPPLNVGTGVITAHWSPTLNPVPSAGAPDPLRGIAQICSCPLNQDHEPSDHIRVVSGHVGGFANVVLQVVQRGLLDLFLQSRIPAQFLDAGLAWQDRSKRMLSAASWSIQGVS